MQKPMAIRPRSATTLVCGAILCLAGGSPLFAQTAETGRSQQMNRPAATQTEKRASTDQEKMKGATATTDTLWSGTPASPYHYREPLWETYPVAPPGSLKMMEFERYFRAQQEENGAAVGSTNGMALSVRNASTGADPDAWRWPDRDAWMDWWIQGSSPLATYTVPDDWRLEGCINPSYPMASPGSLNMYYYSREEVNQALGAKKTEMQASTMSRAMDSRSGSRDRAGGSDGDTMTPTDGNSWGHPGMMREDAFPNDWRAMNTIYPSYPFAAPGSLYLYGAYDRMRPRGAQEAKP